MNAGGVRAGQIMLRGVFFFNTQSSEQAAAGGGGSILLPRAAVRGGSEGVDGRFRCDLAVSSCALLGGPGHMSKSHRVFGDVGRLWWVGNRTGIQAQNEDRTNEGVLAS